MICAGSTAGCQRSDNHEATVAVGVKRDRVIVSIDAGEDRTWPGFATQAMSRDGLPGLTVTGGSKRAGLPGDALAVEDVAGAVDDQDIVGTVAVDVGHQGRGMRRGDELSGSGERAVAVAQQHRHGVVKPVCDGQVGAAVAVEVARH